MKNVIVGYDGSEQSKRALDRAASALHGRLDLDAPGGGEHGAGLDPQRLAGGEQAAGDGEGRLVAHLDLHGVILPYAGRAGGRPGAGLRPVRPAGRPGRRTGPGARARAGPPDRARRRPGPRRRPDLRAGRVRRPLPAPAPLRSRRSWSGQRRRGSRNVDSTKIGGGGGNRVWGRVVGRAESLSRIGSGLLNPTDIGKDPRMARAVGIDLGTTNSVRQRPRGRRAHRHRQRRGLADDPVDRRVRQERRGARRRGRQAPGGHQPRPDDPVGQARDGHQLDHRHRRQEVHPAGDLARAC